MQTQEQASQPKQGSPGQASELVANIHDNMIQLLDMMDKSSAITPEDKQQFAGLIQGYRDFVSKVLAGEGTQRPTPESTTPVEAGVAQVQPA